jgi:crotonobetainyl-CoA:carnitine CoA-transferase CaiB-like acyl-CoA transferase
VLEALHSKAAVERNVVHQMRHASLGLVPQVTSPWSDPIDESTAFDDSKNQTIEILRSSGYEDADIERFRTEKVIH